MISSSIVRTFLRGKSKASETSGITKLLFYATLFLPFFFKMCDHERRNDGIRLAHFTRIRSHILLISLRVKSRIRWRTTTKIIVGFSRKKRQNLRRSIAWNLRWAYFEKRENILENEEAPWLRFSPRFNTAEINFAENENFAFQQLAARGNGPTKRLIEKCRRSLLRIEWC